MAVEGWDWAFVAASLVEIALGAWVFFASPGSPVNRGFALFLFATGLGDLTGAAAPDDPASRAGVSDAAYLAYFVSIAGLVLMALAYPDRKRLEGSERRILRGAWSLVALGIAFVVVGRSGSQGPIESVGLVLAAIILGSQGILAAWVSRHLGQGSSDQQRSTRLIILGLCIWPLWSAGSFLTGLGEGRSGLGWTTTVIMLLSTSAASVAVVRLLRAGDDGRRHWAGLVMLALVFASGLANGLYEARLGTPTYLATVVGLGLVVAYGILRQDMFTLDRKMHFAVSKSTVAAVFIAVFFIASETAQQFFGERLNSTYLGIGVAGTLVFAFAPLQRAAERLAEKAVPIAAPVPATVVPTIPDAPGSSKRAEQAYRAVLRKYLRDGKVTREEERTLAHIAGELRIDAGRAFELREEAEAERKGAR